MKKLLRLLPALLLASCAPSVTGGAGQPQVMASPTSAVVIHPGETKYVQFNYPRSLLNVNDKYFADLRVDFNDRSGTNVSSPRAYAPWLKMTSRKLSRGVNVAMSSAYLVKDIRKTENEAFQTVVNYYEIVQVILKVTAEKDAALGRDLAELHFTDGNTSKSVPVVIEIRAGE